MKRFKLACALYAPILVMALWVGGLLYDSKYGTTIDFKVSGYDPRDLLAGHFLRYSIDYGSDNVPCTSGGVRETCTCIGLTQVEQPGVSQWSGACGELPSTCQTWLRGTCRYGNFEAGIERYYISEVMAKDLQNIERFGEIPENSTIRVQVSRNGSGIVTGFFVKGVPLQEFIKQQ